MKTKTLLTTITLGMAIFFTNAEAKANLIPAPQAKTIALNHAGISPNNAGFISIEQDFDNGRMEYEIDFRSNSYEYDYTINAQTGAIISHSFEKRRNKLFNVFKSEIPETMISAEKAKEIAITHAKLTPNQVNVHEFSYDFDDGEHLYEVGFWKDMTEYSYTINAETGEIFECEVDYNI